MVEEEGRKLIRLIGRLRRRRKRMEEAVKLHQRRRKEEGQTVGLVMTKLCLQRGRLKHYRMVKRSKMPLVIVYIPWIFFSQACIH